MPQIKRLSTEERQLVVHEKLGEGVLIGREERDKHPDLLEVLWPNGNTSCFRTDSTMLTLKGLISPADFAKWAQRHSITSLRLV